MTGITTISINKTEFISSSFSRIPMNPLGSSMLEVHPDKVSIALSNPTREKIFLYFEIFILSISQY